MRILSWNCQGVRNTPTVRHLHGVLGQYSPEILFLSETKNRRRYIEGLVEKFGYHDLKTVEPLGRSGGLAVMWKESCRMEILQANRRVIDMRVKWQYKSFFLSCIYREPVKNRRSEFWKRLTRIGVSRNEPWVMT